MSNTSTVLIVDDDQSARETLEAMLWPQGYNLVFAVDGPTALAQAAQDLPDIVLLDVMMPGMSGFEVCRRLRSNPHTAQAPIILVTALDDRDSRLRGLEAGADEFVTKPFDRAELRARVGTLLQLDRYRRLMAERARFEWVVQNAGDGYLLLDSDDQAIYANPIAKLYLGLPAQAEPPAHSPFGELASRNYRCEPREIWEAWPAPGPRYLIRPESPTTAALWLQVDVLDLPSVMDNQRLVRLHDITPLTTLRRDVWELQTASTRKHESPLVTMLRNLELQTQLICDEMAVEIMRGSPALVHSLRGLHARIAEIVRYVDAPILATPGEGFETWRLRALIMSTAEWLRLSGVTLALAENAIKTSLTLSEQAVGLVFWEIFENMRGAQHIDIKVERNKESWLQISLCACSQSLSPQDLVLACVPGGAPGSKLSMHTATSLVWSTGGSIQVRNLIEQAALAIDIELPLLAEAPVAQDWMRDPAVREDERAWSR